MSISGISSDPTVYQNYASNPFQQIRKDLAAVKTSLASGNLSDAQEAFDTLQQDMQAISRTGQQTGGSSALDNDLAAIDKALKSGDLPGAQKAFSKLQQDMQQMRQAQGGQQAQKTHHHHRHHGGSAENTASTLLNDLAAIGSALQSNDLAGAQKAFATLQQDTKNSSGQNTTSTPGPDLTSLVGALQSNDLAGAQKAFATLQQDLQNTIPTLGNGTSQSVGTNIDVAT